MIAAAIAFAPLEPADADLRALADALGSEWHLLDELAGLVRRQREAIGRDDLQEVEDTVYATHRVLLTLREARRRRRTLNRLLGWSEAMRLGELEEMLGGRMGEPLRAARDGLCGAARALAREVEVNRSVLRTALAAADEYARALAAAGSVAAGYPAPPGEGERPVLSLLDRTA